MKSIQRQFYLVSFLVAALVLLLVPAAFAQDVELTVEQNPVSVVTPAATEPAPPAPAPSLSDPMIQMSVWQLVAGFATAFSLGGLTIGTGIGLLASRLRHNPATMAAIEGLAASTPDTTIQLFNGLMDKFQYSLTEAFALAREALDKKPAAEKTPEEREAVLYPGVLEGTGGPGALPRSANRDA